MDAPQPPALGAVLTACSFPGCEKPSVARTFCATHYQRWRRTGTPNDRQPKADVDRIVELVALGLSYREIAGALRVHPNTVKQVVAEIRRKAGVGSKAELAELVNGRG